MRTTSITRILMGALVGAFLFTASAAPAAASKPAAPHASGKKQKSKGSTRQASDQDKKKPKDSSPIPTNEL